MVWESDRSVPPGCWTLFLHGGGAGLADRALVLPTRPSGMALIFPRMYRQIPGVTLASTDRKSVV